MPDGDKIHKGLRYFYQNAYRLLCSDPFEAEDVAREILMSLRKAINYDGGNLPFRQLESVAGRLETLPQDSLARQLVDWAEEASVLEQLTRSPRCKKRIAALVLDTSKGVLNDLRHGRMRQKDPLLELHSNYLKNLYRGEFEERVPLTLHHNGLNQHVINERLTAIRPHVMECLEKFAAQKRRNNVAPLRMPKRTLPAKPIILHETDLLGRL